MSLEGATFDERNAELAHMLIDPYIEQYREWLSAGTAVLNESSRYLHQNGLDGKVSRLCHFGASDMYALFTVTCREGQIPFDDAHFEFSDACFNAFSGNYRTAAFHLRSFLELCFWGVCLRGQEPAVLQSWRNGELETPRFGDLRCALLGKSRTMKLLPDRRKIPILHDSQAGVAERYRRAQDNVRLDAAAGETYGGLSSMVHNQSGRRTNPEMRNSLSPRFNEEPFCEFLDLLEKCVRVVVALLFLSEPAHAVTTLREQGNPTLLSDLLGDWWSRLERIAPPSAAPGAADAGSR